MNLDKRQILEACQNLWQTTLGLRLDEVEQPNEPAREGQHLQSYVNISGDWRGAVIVECPESVTRHAAAMLYASDADDITAQELQDTLNELARMVGKNIQKVLPQPGKISSPRAITGGEAPKALMAMRDVGDLHLDCEGHPVRISVLESEPVPA